MQAITPVSVTAVRFTRQFESIPTRMELDGVSYHLTPAYKKITLKSEEGTIAFFDLSDGTRRFRLKQVACTWLLLSTSSVNA